VLEPKRQSSPTKMVRGEIAMKNVKRMIQIDDSMFVCIADIPSLHGRYNGIYFNESKPWFHLRECVITQQCVANWKVPLTDEECAEWILEGASESIVHWKEFVACADEHLYVKTE